MVGTDHTLAPLALRERFALEAEAAAMLLQTLRTGPAPDFVVSREALLIDANGPHLGAAAATGSVQSRHNEAALPTSRPSTNARQRENVLADDLVIQEAALLSTCNRFELYLAVKDPEAAIARVRMALAATLGLAGADLDPMLVIRRGRAAVAHLCAVASGLQSMVVAESQILGQVRGAIDTSARHGAGGPHLAAAFRTAIACGKRVRTETAIGRADISVGSVMLDLIARQDVDWPAQRVMLVGAGRMNAITAARLRAFGAGEIVVTSRTPEAAAGLAESVGGRAIPMARLAASARASTLIVSATRSPGLMLTAEMLADRPEGPLTIVDLAVPRDVDPGVRDLPGITLIDIDVLSTYQDRHGLTEALAEAAVMVEEATAGWETWCRTREAVPLIADLRAHVDRQKETELQRTLAQLEHLPEAERAAVEEMAHRLVNKMFHHLAVRMKQAAADPELGETYLNAARYLFSRDDTTTRDGSAIADRRE